VDDDSGLTRIKTPAKPIIRPITCFGDTLSFNQKKAIIIVLNAVVAFNIASIFELDSKLASENNVKGIAQFVMDNIAIYFHIGFKSFKYLGCNNIGKKMSEAIINLELTKAIGPNSGVPIFVNIKALTQIAPRNVSKAQYLNSIKSRS